MNLSPAFRARIMALPDGRAWLARLPGLLADCCRRWSLTLGPPFPLSYNYVCPATTAAGASVVLKVGIPNDEFLNEQAALRQFSGKGAVQLIQAAPDLGAFLLERLHPGTPLSGLTEDHEMTVIAAGVMEALWTPPPEDHSFPTTAEWARGMARLRHHYHGGTGPFPRRLVEAAETAFADLLPSQGPPTLLHGDLHHGNILRTQTGGWLAVDPKGLIGEREYEVGALLRNPDLDSLDNAALERQTNRRLDQLAERLGFDRARLAAWGLAQAVLSAWWGIEDGEGLLQAPLRLAACLA